MNKWPDSVMVCIRTDGAPRGILSAFGNFFRKESGIDFLTQTEAAPSSFFARTGHGFHSGGISASGAPG
jgi:hypothetical protein